MLKLGSAAQCPAYLDGFAFIVLGLLIVYPFTRFVDPSGLPRSFAQDVVMNRLRFLVISGSRCLAKTVRRVMIAYSNQAHPYSIVLSVPLLIRFTGYFALVYMVIRAFMLHLHGG